MTINTKILIKRRAALGDVVMSTGVVRELYKAHRGRCAITVETEFPLVYKNNPYIKSLRNWGEVSPADYDVVYNLSVFHKPYCITCFLILKVPG